ncbi:MAG: M14 family zinc carboxypeptidase [Verrucomicrobiota bacterium]
MAADDNERKVDGRALIDSLDASGLPTLGRSRGGIAIRGGWLGGAAGPRSLPGLSPRRLLVVGGVHGDEPASVEAVGELGLRLRAAAPGRAGVFVVPALNPDGLLLGQKDSMAGVDLNRNFPALNFTRAHSAGYDPGPFPLSEPETAVLARLIEEQRVGAVVAVHAPFACVNFDGPARAWAEHVGAACGWPVRESIGYPTPGSLGSWLGVDAGVPVLTLELPAGPARRFRGAAAMALDAAIASVEAAR